MIRDNLGVYLFDEFDAIGGERSLDNDVGEMRRVLNSFLQFIEQDSSDSLIIGASNNPKLLDQALFRRFDDILYYNNPENEQIKILIQNLTATYLSRNVNWEEIFQRSKDLSYAEIDMACRDALKQSILSNQNQITSSDLITFLNERQLIHNSK